MNIRRIARRMIVDKQPGRRRLQYANRDELARLIGVRLQTNMHFDNIDKLLSEGDKSKN